MRHWCCVLLLGLCLPVWGDGWRPDPAQSARLVQSVESRWTKLFDTEGRMRNRQTSIDLAGLALDAVASGYRADRIQTMLDALYALQDADPRSKTLGNMFWYQGDTRLVDRNGVEFVTRKAALLWVLYRDRLDQAQRERLLPLLQSARGGIDRHEVRIGYTNIFLMKTWNRIALGEGLGDEALARQGYQMLADWTAYTARTGINEYLSPSYYHIDLENLALIANLTRNPSARVQAQRAIDYFWNEIALNWYAPANRLGGAHSRDYNRLFNVGGLNAAVAQSGLTGLVPAPADNPYDFYSRAPAPASAQKWLAGPWPRYVSGRWGEAPEQRWHHFIGRQFSIGSSEATYPSGHDNAPLVINLGAGSDVPVINFFMDGRRDHYGQNKTLEAGSGHMKALHLRPFLTSVQNDGAVLFSAAVSGRGVENVALESVITLPADAEFWLGERKLDFDTHSSAWRFDFAPNGTTTRIDTGERNDRVELRLLDADPVLGVGIAQMFPVQAGRTYRIGASLQGGPVSLYLNYYDASRKLIGGELIKPVSGGELDFETRDFGARAPEGAVLCKAWLYSPSRATTEIRIADLYFDEVGPTPKRLGGFDFSIFKPAAIPVAAGQTLFVRRGEAVAALRLLGAWDAEGKALDWTLVNDGLSWRAVRLTAVHSASPTDRRGVVAVWARAGDGIRDDADFAAWRRSIASETGHAELRDEVLEASVGPLKIRTNLATSRHLLREGMKPVPPSATLWVDGQDLAPALLGSD